MTSQARKGEAGRSHPSQAELERFMRGELPSGEAASVVRHLLRSCVRCSAVTRKLWRFGETPLWQAQTRRPNHLARQGRARV